LTALRTSRSAHRASAVFIMRRMVIALIVGVAMGYHWGFDEGSAGKETIVARTLERFGTKTIKAAQDAHAQRVDEAMKP
jgi:hypothetical protein